MCIVAAPAAAAGASAAGAGAAAAAAGAAASATAASAATAATAATSAFTIQSALTALTTLGTFVQQSQNAKAQERAQERAAFANHNLAVADAVNNYNAANRRTAQERARAAVEIQGVVRAARQAAGTARAVAGDHGVAGESLRELLSDFEKKAADYTSGTQRNLAFAEESVEAQKRGIRGQLEGRILSTLPGGVQKPSFFNAALRLGGGIYNSYLDNSFIDPNGVRRIGVLSQPTGTQ